MGLKALLFLIALSFIVYSCNEDSASPYGRIYEIPSTVGSYWKYALYDSISGDHDTVDVSIISSIAFEDGKVTQWIFKNAKKITDTLTVVFSGDSISAALGSFSQKYRMIFISPLVVGLEYNTIYGTMNIQEIENVTNEVNNFISCFRILNSFESSSEMNNITYWVKPGIGIVKAHRSSFATIGFQQQEVFWDLIDYNILH